MQYARVKLENGSADEIKVKEAETATKDSAGNTISTTYTKPNATNEWSAEQHFNAGFTALNGSFSFSDPTNVGMELGRRDGTAGTPYIDFHTDGQSGADYNSRLLATGDSLQITAPEGVFINGKKIDSITTSNPNLLLNPDWRVNQKGQVLYNNSYNNNYTFDRWNYWCDLSAPNISYNTDGGYLTFVNVEGTKPAQIVQYIDPVDVPLKVGGYYTMSAEYTTNLSDAEAGNFTRISRTFTLLVSGNSGWIDFEGNACDLICGYGARGSVGNVYSICLRTTKTIYVRYIKLEQGQAATDFIPPIYSEELLKCQRYYYQSRSGLGFLLPITQVNSGGTDRRANFQFPVTMRETPTVTVLATIGSSQNQSLNTEFVNPDSCVIIRNGYTPQSGHQAPEVTSIKADAEL